MKGALTINLFASLATQISRNIFCLNFYIWSKYLFPNALFLSKYKNNDTYLNGLSAAAPLLWDLWWNRRFPLSGNDLPHSLQAKGRSPVWDLIWLTKCSLRVKGFEQILQQWGVSPVCCRKWFVKCSFRVKVFWQNSQRCGDSPVRKNNKPNNKADH